MRLNLNITHGVIASLLALLTSGAGRVARAADLSSVSGTVVDSGGGAVAEATVTLRQGLREAYRTSTNASGRFSFAAQVGRYEISVRRDGFSVTSRSLDLPLAPGDALRIELRPGAFVESVEVVGTRLAGSVEAVERLPGSVDTLDAAALEGSRVLNVNEALRKASGVNVRDEEGLGLRPNIGIRGLNPTRSSKTLLLEDGLFLTYAPYGDNASYYHPPIERFDGVEIVKGAGQIAYGPVTVGGVVNYLTPAPPAKPQARLRAAFGNRRHFSGLASAGGTWGRTGLLAEIMRKQGDGARDNLNSAVNDVNLKLVATVSDRQFLTLKGNYYDEDSMITYSGLTLSEWTANPRQNPFINDAFNGWRVGGSVKHSLILGDSSLLTTHVYGSRFSRDWWRQSSNSSQRPNDRSDPACAGMQNLLTACGNEGRLRDFDHFGIEPRLRLGLTVFGLRSEAELGVRAHAEIQERIQANGTTPLARQGLIVEDNRRTNQAYSTFLQNRILLGDVTLSTGVRFESIEYQRTNRLGNGGAGARGTTRVTQWIPGIGLAFTPGERLTLFTGLHRGFAPPRTEDIISQSGGVVQLDAERSWNMEAGLRALPLRGVRLDATWFRNDYSNQVVAASLAGGSGATFTNGGATLQQGAEVGLRLDSTTIRSSPHTVFLRAAFTLLATARFQGVRFSSVSGSSGVRVSGNRLPYAPQQFVTISAGVTHASGLRAQIEAAHVADQFSDDLNSVASSADGQRGLVPAFTIWNATLNFDRGRVGLYVSGKNLLDRLYIADRSRGLIPGPQRLVMVGLSARF